MNSPITVSALIPAADDYPEMSNELIADYEEALDLVIAGRWPEALDRLRLLPQSDGPTQFLVRQMTALGNTPPANWDGAFSLDRK